MRFWSRAPFERAGRPPGRPSGGHMRSRHFVVGGLLLAGIVVTPPVRAQDPADEIRVNTMRPVIRGRTHAAASMKPEATRAAERILQAGGNPLAPPLASQAMLGLVDAPSHGVGS